MTRDLTRRLMMGGLAAAPLAGCATGARRPSEPATVQVNLTAAPLPPPPPSVAGAEADGALRTGFDAVRRMTVKTMIDESGPYAFVVDTGANRSVLSAEIADALTLPTSGQAMVHGIAGVLPSRTTTVRRLTVGNLVSRRVKMPVLPRGYLGADGLLGVDVLANRRATMDFANQVFTLEPPRARDNAGSRIGKDPLPGEVVVDAKQRFGQLTIVNAEMGGVPLTAFLDSGAEITVGNTVLRDALLGRPGVLGARRTQVELVSATGQLVGGELAVAPPLRLGGVRLGNLTCVFADLHTFRIWDLTDRPAMLIGVDVMRHFDSITLDFAQSDVTFRSKAFARNAG
ncbi:MAG: retroviral-like aspartic protease family protein [Pseudomonadota bacterium]